MHRTAPARGQGLGGRRADTVIGARHDRDVPSCHHGSLSGQRPGTCRAEASAANEAQPSSRRKTPDATGTHRHRPRPGAGAGKSGQLSRTQLRTRRRRPGCQHARYTESWRTKIIYRGRDQLTTLFAESGQRDLLHRSSSAFVAHLHNAPWLVVLFPANRTHRELGGRVLFNAIPRRVQDD